jgi:hypothetical protein
MRASLQVSRASLSLWVLACVACATPEGPRLALPSQDLATPVPAGYVRVVFFNDTVEALYPASGNIRVQLNGSTAPSLYLNHYAQLFVAPGRYELMLEHWDLVTFTDHYTIELRGPEMFIRIWCSPVSTKYEVVGALPESFEEKFIGGRDPAQWPAFEP